MPIVGLNFLFGFTKGRLLEIELFNDSVCVFIRYTVLNVLSTLRCTIFHIFFPLISTLFHGLIFDSTNNFCVKFWRPILVFNGFLEGTSFIFMHIIFVIFFWNANFIFLHKSWRVFGVALSVSQSVTSYFNLWGYLETHSILVCGFNEVCVFFRVCITQRFRYFIF